MEKAILGTKIGMTQIFGEGGVVIPVTVVMAGPCVVTQKKTVETDGYEAVQVGFGDVKEKHLNKPQLGHFKKADTANKKYVREFRLDDCESLNVGDEIKADIFAAGDKVDVSGISKGKGFAAAAGLHPHSVGADAERSCSRRRSVTDAACPLRVLIGPSPPQRKAPSS